MLDFELFPGLLGCVEAQKLLRISLVEAAYLPASLASNVSSNFVPKLVATSLFGIRAARCNAADSPSHIETSVFSLIGLRPLEVRPQ